ncbi:hypothetical protein VSDG_05927 [Cytospora chrysosperma]|uniref:DUF4045 domain-containing protein n=1 Tax=Cytospora chrysosperma TaxID=252740 RepID=A0A423VTU7_CYTCH|nr:hypothetical protein VSDG_05927 [Valsa sordida]
MSNEVSDFLRSVEQLNHSRDEDEEARSRELEEKLLQQRKERQARREARKIHLPSEIVASQHPTTVFASQRLDIPRHRGPYFFPNTGTLCCPAKSDDYYYVSVHRDNGPVLSTSHFPY